MSPYFYSLEMLVHLQYSYVGECECHTCDGLRQRLYDLSREENR